MDNNTQDKSAQADDSSVTTEFSLPSTSTSLSTAATSAASATNFKRFKCESCGAEFTRMSNMLRHQKVSCVNDGQKKSKFYSCLSAGCDSKGYSRFDGLEAHIKEKHGGDKSLMMDAVTWYTQLGFDHTSPTREPDVMSPKLEDSMALDSGQTSPVREHDVVSLESEEVTALDPRQESPIQTPDATSLEIEADLASDSDSQTSLFGSSIDSVESKEGSVSTAYSTNAVTSAADEFSSLLIEDKMLEPVYNWAFRTHSQMAEKFTKSLYRWLKAYAQDIRGEFKQHDGMIKAAELVRSRSRYIANQVRQAYDTGYREQIRGRNCQEPTVESSAQRTATIAGLLSSPQSQQHNADLSDSGNEDEGSAMQSRHLASISEVKKLLIGSKAYQQFQDSVKKYLDADSKESKSFKDIRTVVEANMNKRGTQKANFRIKWELMDFCKHELQGQGSLEPVLTVSGSAHDAYAGTCHDYIQRFWSDFGIEVLRHLLELTQSKQHTTQKINSNRMVLGNAEDGDSAEISQVLIHPNRDRLSFHVQASRKVIVKLAQLLAWLVSVFRTPIAGNLAYSHCVFTFEDGTFALHPSPLVTVDPSTGSCWCPMLQGCIIAQDFPIPPRETGRGLEIPFDVMVILGRILYPMEYLDGMVLKGRSTILAPISKKGDSVQWHFLNIREGTIDMDEISHRSITTLEHINLDDLCASRTFVGFCENACVHAGGKASGFEKCDSSNIPLEPSSVRMALEMTPTMGTSGLGFFGGQISSKAVLTKGLSAILEDDDLLLQDELMNSSVHPCLVYDSKTKRAWLVPELNVLLLTAHVWAIRQDDRDALLEKLPFVPLSSPGGKAAYETIKAAGDVCLRKASPFGKEIRLIPLLTQFLKALKSRKEKVIERSNTTANVPLLRKFKASKLSGWELQDISTFQHYFRRKTTDLEGCDGKAWTPIVEENPHIVVLFCSGLNELIGPSYAQDGLAENICPAVPCGSSLLAATGEVVLHMSQSSNTDADLPPCLGTNLYLDNQNGRRSFNPHEYTRPDGSICILSLSNRPSKLANRLKASDAVVIGSAKRGQKLLPNPNRHRKSSRQRSCIRQETPSSNHDTEIEFREKELDCHDHLSLLTPLPIDDHELPIQVFQPSYVDLKGKKRDTAQCSCDMGSFLDNGPSHTVWDDAEAHLGGNSEQIHEAMMDDNHNMMETDDVW